MGTRQYIGARYVPKFADPIAWDNTRSYEALEIVTNLNTSYTSKKPVPVGIDITNSEYWVATGNYNAQVEQYHQEVVELENAFNTSRAYINLEDFGVTGSGDESDKMIDAVEFCSEHNIYEIVSHTDIMISNVAISGSMTIDFNGHKIKGIRIHETTDRVKQMLTFEGGNVVIKNCVFEGYDDIVDTGEKPDMISPLFFNACNSVHIMDCTFQNFDEMYYQNMAADLVDREADLAKMQDCIYTEFNRCTVNNCKGHELFYVVANTLPREAVDGKMCNCTITDINTSVVDFVGNNWYSENNIFDWDYDGSAVNVFALNLFVNADQIKGDFKNVYDNCEAIYYQGNSVNIKNVKITGTIRLIPFELSAKDIVLENIDYDVPANKILLALRGGYQVDNPFKYGAETALNSINARVINCHSTNVRGALIYNSECSYGKATLIQCSFTGMSCVFIGDVEIVDCDITPAIVDSQAPWGIFTPNVNVPNSIIVNGCRINCTVAHDGYLIESDTHKAVVVGNICTATNAIAGCHNADAYVVSGNLGIEDAAS